MIKVLFYSKDYSEFDVEKELNILKDVEIWLEDSVQGISFDCMDFPFDVANNYACYFTSVNDVLAKEDILHVIQKQIGLNSKINFEISIVNNCFD